MSPASIMIVEDDDTLVDAITRNLSARGYMVRHAGTVAAALALLQEATPSLVLLDIDLPDGSGWEVVRSLRGAGHGDVAIIAMSALQPNKRLARELNCTGVLEKPFPIDSLLRLVADAIGRPDTRPNTGSN